MNLRYQKADKWGSEVFIASPKYPEEEKAFETLRTLASKVEDMNLGTFSPVFHNDVLDYCTIRFKFYKGMKLEERNLYTVNFVIKKSTSYTQDPSRKTKAKLSHSIYKFPA